MEDGESCFVSDAIGYRMKDSNICSLSDGQNKLSNRLKKALKEVEKDTRYFDIQ